MVGWGKLIAQEKKETLAKLWLLLECLESERDDVRVETSQKRPPACVSYWRDRDRSGVVGQLSVVFYFKKGGMMPTDHLLQSLERYKNYDCHCWALLQNTPNLFLDKRQ